MQSANYRMCCGVAGQLTRNS